MFVPLGGFEQWVCVLGSLIWIGSLYYFSSISMLSKWKQNGGISLQGCHFSVRSQFGKLGFGTFRSHFEELNDFFFFLGGGGFGGVGVQNMCTPH
jgi:hypothetical protein